MITQALPLSGPTSQASAIKFCLSFAEFITYLENKVAEEYLLHVDSRFAEVRAKEELQIVPKLPFRSEYLQKLRLWQVQSMAALTKVTHSLLAMMPHTLYITQVLYVNDRTIDITFRNDERRFVVEGYYNIRYQVIKKRLDKVHMLHTNEHLTQPQKITRVYFEVQNVQEYIRYIPQLQEEHILLNNH